MTFSMTGHTKFVRMFKKTGSKKDQTGSIKKAGELYQIQSTESGCPKMIMSYLGMFSPLFSQNKFCCMKQQCSCSYLMHAYDNPRFTILSME